MNVIKRSGEEVVFDASKIENAIKKIMFKNALKMGYTKKIPKKFEKSAKFPPKKHQKIINFWCLKEKTI